MTEDLTNSAIDDQQLAEQLRATVYTLASTIGERNTKHYDKLIEARDFLTHSLQQLKCEVSLHSYEVDGMNCPNIVAERKGADRPEGIVVLGAHYDSIRGGVGANDNASGVAGILALAKLLSEEVTRKTLRFVCFVNEEQPYTRSKYMGSLVYAQACKEKGENIEAMLCLETIGYFPEQSKQHELEPWLYRVVSPSDKAFVALISNESSRGLLSEMETLFQAASDFPLKTIALPGALPGAKSSDHWSFWKQGYPAVMVTDTAWARYPFYHTKEDTPEKLDYLKMARHLRGLAGIARGLGSRP